MLPGWEVPLLTSGLALVLPALLLAMWGLGGRSRLAGQHALITGGSKGLGLALAHELVARGCSVTILARDQAGLAAALQQLQAAASAVPQRQQGGAPPPKLQALSADTGDLPRLQAAIAEAEAGAGPIDLLVCNAGYSRPGLFMELELADFERQMDVNYMGNVRTLKAALPGMLRRRRGRVVVVASPMGVLGFAGYTGYSPSKWALRGLADSLRNELQGTGVQISVAYPPDTDTPGYATELETKPGLCHAVNEALGSELFQAQQVARSIARGIERGSYHLPAPDVGQRLLIGILAGVSPRYLPLPLHMLLGPFVPLITLVLTWIMDRTARRYNTQHGPPLGAAGSGSSAAGGGAGSGGKASK